MFETLLAPQCIDLPFHSRPCEPNCCSTLRKKKKRVDKASLLEKRASRPHCCNITTSLKRAGFFFYFLYFSPSLSFPCCLKCAGGGQNKRPPFCFCSREPERWGPIIDCKPQRQTVGGAQTESCAVRGAEGCWTHRSKATTTKKNPNKQTAGLVCVWRAARTNPPSLSDSNIARFSSSFSLSLSPSCEAVAWNKRNARGVTPACRTVRVSARRCLTPNAIFRKETRSIAFEWLGRGRMASCDSVAYGSSQWRWRASCVHMRWRGATAGILPRPSACSCVGWVDETGERAERYRHAVIRPYIWAGRTIFLLKTASSSHWFPLSDVAYLCGAPVKSETGRSRLFFFPPMIWFLLFLLFVCFFSPFFVSCICWKEPISVLWFNKYFISSFYLVCVWLLCFQVWAKESGIHHFTSYWPGVFHSEIVCPKDVHNFHL